MSFIRTQWESGNWTANPFAIRHSILPSCTTVTSGRRDSQGEKGGKEEVKINKYVLWITVNLHNFPEIERSTRLQGRVGFHRHALLERLPDALSLQVGRGEHQQEHATVSVDRGERRSGPHIQNTKPRKRNKTRWQRPHDETHDDVKLQLPGRPWQTLRACGQHVVGQRGVQDEHKLGAAARDKLQLPDHSRWGEVGCKPEGETRKALFACSGGLRGFKVKGWVRVVVLHSLCFTVQATTADQTTHCWCLFALQIKSQIPQSFSSASKSQLLCAAGEIWHWGFSLAPPLVTKTLLFRG